MDKYAVLLKNPKTYHPPTIAKVIQAFREIPYQDAIHLARASWGILGENLEKVKAENLIDLLPVASLEGVLWPQDKLSDLPMAKALTGLEFSDDTLRINIKGGESQVFSWSEIKITAAAGFNSETFKVTKQEKGSSFGQKMMDVGILMSTGIPMGLFRKKKEAVQSQRSVDFMYFMDLFFKDSLERYRIDAQAFDYSCLKEKMVYNVLGNLRALITEITQKGKGSLWNKGVRDILESRPVSSMDYRSLDEIERECRWLACLTASKP